MRLREILEKILAVVNTLDVGTIVFGTHGRMGLAHLLLGSIAEKIIRSVQCPVYVIRHSDRQSERMAA
jgi:nucleotide-binding universal stress UspA family protein